MTEWVRETLHAGFQLALESQRTLFDSRTEHQRLKIFENPSFGRVMTLDGVIQTTEADEFIYHEMLAHVPILAHGRVRRVLVIGGGDGGMLEEVLKHRTVEQATLVEIDPTVIELAREHLPSICRGAFDDPRTRVVIADGTRYVAETDERYDLIITDSTDPIGPGEVLFEETYYARCKRCLNPGGVLVTQNGVPFLQGPELTQTMTSFRRLFADAACYLATVPTYAGGPMAFGWGTDDAALRGVSVDVLAGRFAESGVETRYYTPEVHRAAFAIPPYVTALYA
jgi:spermidine synthase